MSNFFLKHFALITASRIFIVGNHSDIRKNQLHTKHVAKMFSWNTFLLSEYIFKAVVNQRESIIKNAIAEKTLNRLLQLFIFVILFEMHERVTSMEKEFETVFVDNKAKRANLKTGVSRKQSSSNFPKNRHFLCISGGKKCSFFGKLGVRCFLALFWDSPFCLITDALQIRLEHTLTQKFNSIRHFGWSEHSKKTGSKVDYSKKLVERRRWVF